MPKLWLCICWALWSQDVMQVFPNSLITTGSYCDGTPRASGKSCRIERWCDETTLSNILEFSVWTFALEIRLGSQSSMQVQGFVFATNSINQCLKLKTGTNDALSGVCFFASPLPSTRFQVVLAQLQQLFPPKARRSFLTPKVRTEKFTAPSSAA